MSRMIFLAGIPGSGKTEVGKALSRKLNSKFIDLDGKIEANAGQTIAQIFQHGEWSFRQLETAALQEIICSEEDCVTALGGGTLLSAENRSMLAGAGTTVWLQVSPSTAAGRIASERDGILKRPLLSDKVTSDLTELLIRRQVTYTTAQIHMNSEESVEAVAQELAIAIEHHSLGFPPSANERATRMIHAKSTLGDYPIIIGVNYIDQLLERVREHKAATVFIASDTPVWTLYGAAIQKAFLGFRHDDGTEVILYFRELPWRERAKRQSVLFGLLELFSSLKFDRRSTLVIAFGGGSICDLVGLAASLYHRGLPLILMPTTLLAQVDAAIGGKNGINFAKTKNLLGTYYPPKAVSVDPVLLCSLPDRDLRNGIVEILKVSLITSPEFFSYLEVNLSTLLELKEGVIEELIAKSIEAKLAIVEQDEFEKLEGVREALNFGHTVGHAIEAASKYHVMHGEAVAVGIIAAARLSTLRGTLSADELQRIERIVGRLKIELSTSLTATQILPHILSDKKNREGVLRMVLLRGIGQAEIVVGIPHTTVSDAIDYALRSLHAA